MSEKDDDEEQEREVAAEGADRQRKAEPAPVLSREDFLIWRSPRPVAEQATRLDNPLWHWLVRTRWSAYRANDLFAGPSCFDDGPMWSFDRFGKSETLLPDGRVFHIGGEHEDHYDPDFFIYNDVTVVMPDGDIAIYGYPVDAFPTTDFHSATLVGDAIFIIGCLGNPGARKHGSTPVFRLTLDSMRICPVESSGPFPGWIYRHAATLAEDGHSIVISGGEQWMGADRAIIENIDVWSFDTLSGAWTRLIQRDWQRQIIVRADRQRSRIWDVRQERWNRRHAYLGMTSYWKFDDEPDFAELDMLYRLDDTPPPSMGQEAGALSVIIDGVTVRIREAGYWTELIVEGRLAPERWDDLRTRTLALIGRLEASTCEFE